MSSSLVKLALDIVDENLPNKSKKEKRAKDLSIGKHSKHLPSKKRTTISEFRKTFKSKEEIYKTNLQKLELLRKATTLKINEDIKNKIIERNITRKPVMIKPDRQKDSETVFTEEDFKRFEEEYTGE